jgi:hypothetical protein
MRSLFNALDWYHWDMLVTNKRNTDWMSGDVLFKALNR